MILTVRAKLLRTWTMLHIYSFDYEIHFWGGFLDTIKDFWD